MGVRAFRGALSGGFFGIAAVVAVGAFLPPWLTGAIAGTLTRALLWPALLGCALFVLRRGHRAPGARIPLGIGGALAAAVLFEQVLAARPAREATGPEVSVLTANVLFQNARPESTVKAIRANAADLILVQELTPAFADRLQGLGRHASLHPDRGTHGLGILSATPLQREVILRNTSGRAIAQCAETTLAGQRLAVCNVHLASPAGSLQDASRFLGAYEANARQRTAQWQDVVDHLAQRGLPLAIIAGDVNTMELDPLHAQMKRSYVDAWRARHLGLGATFPNLPARPRWLPWPVSGIPTLLRLDYVWSSPALEVLDAEVVDGSGSDHHAVRARLRLPGT